MYSETDPWLPYGRSESEWSFVSPFRRTYQDDQLWHKMRRIYAVKDPVRDAYRDLIVNF